MTIYKIDRNCKGDCKVFENGVISINLYECFDKDKKLRLGNVEIPCTVVDHSIGPVLIAPGERLKIGNDVYLDYPSENRIFLDYGSYMFIYFWARVYGKVEYKGIEFRYNKERGYIYNDYRQMIKPEGIHLPTGLQPLITVNGIKEMEIKRRLILRGECRQVDKIAICF